MYLTHTKQFYSRGPNRFIPPPRVLGDIGAQGLRPYYYYVRVYLRVCRRDLSFVGCTMRTN